MMPVKALAILASACVLGGAAYAHDWYPPWCCDEHDCRELIEARGETVTQTAEGWRLWDGRLVGREYAKVSPDARFHLCEEPTTRAIVCFFAPQGAS
ncbi:hypothetical protein [Microvirga splendida]|uniref:Uncharacterized protein n=1 Tax=Microvirga splendida TaxID=2795727 RepID=A0ABS0XWF8_9HYPH|nr:hypothetical protein [Microvirga splendida]MBJ6124378.1 hypothetical protein [Microvirga splendida]